MKKSHKPKNAVESAVELAALSMHLMTAAGPNVKAVAELLGVERNTLTRWIGQGKITQYGPARLLGELADTNPDSLADYVGYKKRLEQKQKKGGEGGGDGRDSRRARRQLAGGRPDNGE